MSLGSAKISVYIETGNQRTFAGAIHWPGWCRSGRDEASAIRTLAEYGSRYARAIGETRLGFEPPADASAFSIVERLKGDATTDFGAPAIPPEADAKPIKPAEIPRSEAILRACWRAFDRAVNAAKGSELRKGPRGGGRELDGIVRHILEADAAYLAKIGWAFKPEDQADPDAQFRPMRGAIVEALSAAAGGKLPARGPRGGLHWSPRYFVRRVAWHTLDHAWEIEDRTS